MLHSIVGLMNSGKTLYMTYKLFLDYCKGKTIITNYDVAFPHRKVNKDFILHLATNNIVLENVSMGFDELWLWIDSRRSLSTENTVSSYFFLQSSKDDTNIYFTAQDNSQNELRIRHNLHKISICSRVLLDGNRFRKIDSEQRFLSKEEQKILYIEVLEHKRMLIGFDAQLVPIERIYIKASDIFGLYDTKQKMVNKNAL